MYARPTERGQLLDFGVSGKLWRGTLIMYDRTTRSLWSQHNSHAIAGPLVGRSLEIVESEVTDWRSWRNTHPHTTVLVQPRISSGLLDSFETFRLAAGAVAIAGAAILIFRRWRSIRVNA